MQAASILLVDPDTERAQTLVAALSDAGHEVSVVSDEGSATAALATSEPDLVVLELLPQDSDGLDLLRRIASDDKYRSARIVMASAVHDEHTIAAAFDAGADDYIKKPFSRVEFLARVSACLRRPPSRPQFQQQLGAGELLVDDVSRRVTIRGVPIKVSPRQYRLLKFFVANPDRLFTRQQLLAQVWDSDKDMGERTVDVHIRRLRSVLEPLQCDNYVQTVRSGGYRFSTR
jgi:two-component system phosphate regulon response regulator PhoB